MADALRNLGEPITDRNLVLNLLRGLNGRFEAISLHLRRGRPFPSLLQACNDLLLKELTMAPTVSPSARATAPSATALLASNVHSSPATPTAQQRPPSLPPAHPGGSEGKRGMRGKRGDGRGAPATGMPNATSGGPPSGQPWMPNLHQPWTGSINMWPGPRPATLPHPHALLAGVQ